MLPQDDLILLGFVNTKLRDEEESLSALCRTLDVSEEEIIRRLGALGYVYDEKLNRFR